MYWFYNDKINYICHGFYNDVKFFLSAEIFKVEKCFDNQFEYLSR